MNGWIATLTAALTLAAAQFAWSQNLTDLRKMYDAGQYQQVVTAASTAQAPDDQRPRITYLAAQSQQKLSHRDDARRLFEQIAARGDGDPWRDVGRSAVAMLTGDTSGAVDAANQAVARAASMPEAQFQRGLALSARQDMAGAATAFERATQLDPSWADAHYYAGLAYSKVKRIDLMAQHFETFLKLAPQAPERPEVQSIMRTLAGK
jgi:tetratricopeptide (TPR) repeat protein